MDDKVFIAIESDGSKWVRLEDYQTATEPSKQPLCNTCQNMYLCCSQKKKYFESGKCLKYAKLKSDNPEPIKESKELRAQVEMLRDFVAEAVEWSTAYPEHIFTAPTPEQVDAVCKTLGFRIDRIAAMVLREFTGKWSGKAQALLAATDPKQ